jgi:hypothetical protein
MLTVSAVESGSKEVLIGTETVISCKITEITEQMDIEWSGFEKGDNFVQDLGTYNAGTKSQTGTLTVKSPDTDKTYTCSVSSTTNKESTVKNIDVHLNVYGKILIFVYFSEIVLSM